MKKDFLVKIMKSRLGVYLVEMRVWQWTKNLLVFTPLIFSLSADNIALLEKATATKILISKPLKIYSPVSIKKQ